MTIIKQTGVQSSGHMKNLRGYINDDRKVILRDSLNMDGCTNPKRWAHHMWMTREAYGHNKAARRVRDKKTGELKEAKNTILFHQILGFNPDECDLNGGRLSPEECMRYAKEYVGKHYPNQQIVMALHNEYCKADKTHRYAVHIVINRTDLSTGKRLDEGRGKSAKVKRASRIRDLDREWGLKQVVEGERNSSVHKKQPSRIEKELAARGIDSYKTNLRELCRIAAGEAENIYDYRELLESWGVDTEFKRGRMYVTDTDNNRYAFSVAKLDAEMQTSERRGWKLRSRRMWRNPSMRKEAQPLRRRGISSGKRRWERKRRRGTLRKSEASTGSTARRYAVWRAWKSWISPS